MDAETLNAIIGTIRTIVRLIPHINAGIRYIHQALASQKNQAHHPLNGLLPGGKPCSRYKGATQKGPSQEGSEMQSTRSTSLQDTFATLTRWAANAIRALNPRPVLPAAPCPWDGTGICTAVIRGGGTAHTATAALAYTSPDGTEHLKLFRGHSTYGTPGHAAAAARLDALAFILNNPTGARATRLFIDDPTLRREITAFQDSFPSLQLTTTADTHLSTLASRTAARANSVTIHTSASAALLTLHRPASERRLVIATDASIIPGQAGAGISAVASDGTVWQDRLPGTADITWAEMKAIHAAITQHPGHHELLVLSDSKAAIAFANGTAIPTQARMRRLAAQIGALRAGRAIEITWVRAHNGHALNEAADALARQARHTPAVASAA